jgi:hypothetical protein
MSSSDEPREKILAYLYRVFKEARSRSKSHVTISVLKRELKKEGLKEQEIVGGLEYLIQSEWVKIDKDEWDFIVPQTGRKIHQKQEYYRIMDKGINHFEGPSKFQRVDKSLTGINVTNIGGVATIGNDNVVNIHHVDLYRALSNLFEAVKLSPKISDVDKLSHVKDIETIESQLSKPEPDKNIIRIVWEKLRPLAEVEGVISFFLIAAEMIERLIA